MSVSITINGVAYDVPSSAADTNWAADQVAFEQAIAAALAPQTWTAATLINSWANLSGAGTAGHAIDSTGRVWLRGAVDSGTSETVAFVLPAGRRPLVTQYLMGQCPGTGASGAITITSNGNVTLSNMAGGDVTNDGLSLAGLSFSTVT